MKTACEIIRDLLPLYHDGVCSEKSKELVEDHLRECTECQKELQRMDDTWNAPNLQIEEQTVAQAASSAWKKGRNRAFYKGFTIAACLAAVVLVCTVAFLLASNAERQIAGKVTETHLDETSETVSFVVETEDGEQLGMLVSEETIVFSFVDGFDTTAFREGHVADMVMISADLSGPREKMVTEDGDTVTAYHAKQIEVRSRRMPESATMPDGTEVEVWQHTSATVYMLPNGAELLCANRPVGPGNVHAGGMSLEELPEEAQAAIKAYYEEQGLLYDEQAELVEAYQDYVQSEEPESFETRYIYQEITPTASSETVIYFLTTVGIPINNTRGMEEIRLGAAFDRTTGEPVPFEELINCSPETFVQELMDIARIAEPVMRREMAEAFDPQNMIFYPDNLEIIFPQGTLPSYGSTTGIGIDLRDPQILRILEEEAVPIWEVSP